MTLNPVANSNQKLIADLAVENNLPSICARTDYAENGCLLAYGPGYQTEGSDGARYVDRILKGARPADLPIEQPTKFELVVNLKTASRIGVAGAAVGARSRRQAGAVIAYACSPFSQQQQEPLMTSTRLPHDRRSRTPL